MSASTILAALLSTVGPDLEAWRLSVPQGVPADVIHLADPLDPVAQSYLWEAIFPSIPRGALLTTCILETGCRRVPASSRYYVEGTAIHRLDRGHGEASYRGAYRRGRLQGCPFWPDPQDVEDPEWFWQASTRGNYGTIGAFVVRHMGACVPFEALDVPFFAAWAAAVKIDRACRRYVKVRHRPCSLQAVRCHWAQSRWGTKRCGRTIRKMRKQLARSKAYARIDQHDHPTLSEIRSQHHGAQ